MRRTSALTVIIAGAVLAQLAIARPRPASLSVGKRAPVVLIHGTEGPIESLAACTTGFIMVESCIHCRRLANRLAADTAVVWLVIGGESAVRTFVEEDGVDPSRTYALYPERNWRGRAEQLDVPLTPLRLVLSHDMRVMNISTSQAVPSRDEMRTLCSGG